MDIIYGKSGHQYSPLPIDNRKGFPQSFSLLFEGQTYHFSLYVNVKAHVIKEEWDFLELPSERAYLVVRIECEKTDGIRDTVFLRKIVRSLEYEAENITFTFPKQRVARMNLNGQGNYRSEIKGGIASRWE